MWDTGRLSIVAELIRDHINLNDLKQYSTMTNIFRDDYIVIAPHAFSGKIFAIDGSNVQVCDWSVGSLNLIRAGYVVYVGKDWQKTVITYDDIFLADPKLCNEVFNQFIEQIFDLKGIVLKESDLDRLSSYFRELMEYIAIDDALDEAESGDIILYDGSFDVFELLREVLNKIFSKAEDKDVVLIGVSKSSKLSWGTDISLPFVQHTSYVGSMLVPRVPWYLNLRGKSLHQMPGGGNWETFIVRFDGRSEHAFRVDVPRFIGPKMDRVFGELSSLSCSAECLGYPHALFRAHRDIRITEQDKDLLRLELMERLSGEGMNHAQIRIMMQNYHDTLEMRFGV